MAANPAAAQAVLEAAATNLERLDYALFLHAYRNASPERDRRIQMLLSPVEEEIAAKVKFWGAEAIGDLQPYDGTDQSLIPTLRNASVSGVAEPFSAHYTIPCGVLERRPGLIVATNPLYGSNRDNFLPRSGCQWGRGVVQGFPQAEVQAYWNISEQASRPDSLTGTSRYGMFAFRNALLARLQVDPHLFLTDPSPPPEFPYETWSYLSLANHAAVGRIDAQFLTSSAALTNYYRTKGLSGQDADNAARRALFAISMGAGCSTMPLQPSLRTLVMDGASRKEIRAFIDSGAWRDESRLQPLMDCAKYGDVEPLIHVALKNVQVLALLQELAATLDPTEAERLDLVMDVNAPNAFGKTPLMTAAQFNLLDAARYLLDHGAEVNRPTDELSLWSSSRTALHYAAASASFPLIRLLVERGADVDARDVKGQPISFFRPGPEIPTGLRPLDYLQGRGPSPPNPLLSARERINALSLLNQPVTRR